MIAPLERLRARLIDLLRRVPAIDARLLIARRERLAAGPGYPDWDRLVAQEGAAWPEALAAARRGRRVLVATSIGSHLPAMQMETTLAAALTLRGAEVDVLLCDAVLPGCQMCEPRLFTSARDFAEHGPQKRLCGHCFEPGRAAYAELGVRVLRYSDGLDADDRARARRLALDTPVDAIEGLEVEGLRVGEHARAGALRFYAKADIADEPLAEPVLRRYLEAALLTAFALRRLLREGGYEVAVFHHGIYVPQGIIGEAARDAGVRVVNWNPAYRRGCFLFSHGDTYHHTLMTEPVEGWEAMPWDDARRDGIARYLRSRWRGDDDWIKFHDDPVFAADRIMAEVGLRPDLPIVGCLTNVMWDAQLHYPANAFTDMLEWLLHTVGRFAERPDLQLVIRVHPAELTGSVPTRQPVVDELARHFPTLPPNVFVIGPESRVSTYVLAELCDSVIIYGTKTGVELTAAGIPVIVAGEAWIRGKGVTADATSPARYDELLDALPRGERLDPATVDRALRYAHHFFFRRMIPVAAFGPGPGWPPFRLAVDRMAALGPGLDPGLDLVCDGILDGAPFVYDPPVPVDGVGVGVRAAATAV